MSRPNKRQALFGRPWNVQQRRLIAQANRRRMLDHWRPIENRRNEGRRIRKLRRSMRSTRPPSMCLLPKVFAALNRFNVAMAQIPTVTKDEFVLIPSARAQED